MNTGAALGRIAGLSAEGSLRIAPRFVEVFPLRAARPVPRSTPFGPQFGPQTVLVKITDDQGAAGWGETWGTFPSGFGVEHRAAFIRIVLAPLLTGRSYESPGHAFAHLSAATRLLANHSGEPGTAAQAIAGVDIALWDLVARRQGLPIRTILGAPRDRVPVYASGLDADRAMAMLPALRAQGYAALKVRLWGDKASHGTALGQVRGLMGPNMGLMADANQSWTPEEAIRQLASFQDLGLKWVEEPLPSDSPDHEWLQLRAGSTIPLAAGENVRGQDGFAHALELGALSVVQPDMCKWGGFSGCVPLARDILTRGLRYCPHYLGGGVGFLASAQLLAAVGGDGVLEHDTNDNPLRQHLVRIPPVKNGFIELPTSPGWGVEPDLSVVSAFLVKE